MELIDFASNDKKAPIDEVDALARAYFDARGLTVNLPADVVGDLVTANVHEGRMDTAQEWLEKFEERCSVDGKQPTAAPYAAFLNAAKDLDPYNTAAFETILDRMKIEGVVPDIHVFNALITAHCIRKHYAAAFAVYRILIEKPSMYPTPNDITYKTLVRATKCVSLQRASRSRRLKPPSNMVPVRQLYHDMLKCHIKQTSGRISKSSDIISPSILQFSLRTFLDIRDYAGAIIVLNSMDMLGYRPNIETYFLVLKHFLERMKTELGRKYPENEQYWTKVILKMGTEGAMNSPGSRKAQPSIGPQTVAFLMRLGEPRRLARDISEDDPQNMSDISQSSTSNTYKYPSSTSRFRLPRSYRVPTMRMLLGKELVLPSIRFSTVPLVRIIRKALMASLITKVKPEDSDQSQEDVLVSIMTSAKRDMVPSLPEGTEGIYSRPEPDKRKWSSSRAVHVFPNGTDKLKRGSG
ncbi:hypothetical protein SERLADRAFT_454479 [Serpula lacrymans var. lacrymans S7.9]|nr:uncharacterized protein SERLADRAFT_454479 [Serpula lacrymans var. lacrymans S7.9]EGO30165.1 hypothetical protein SERLADRAFT_454479 [Serpula lacrymans var. lacrymans S7.9]